jgi:DNA transformation protein
VAITQEYLDYVIDQLRDFGPVVSRRMFGGAGLYRHGVFFGLVAEDVVYFKVDAANKPAYIDAGSAPFKPFGSYAMGYFEVPIDVLEDPQQLSQWARKAFEAAQTGKSGKRKKRPA